MEEIVDFDSFNIFSNKESNAYFWQEYICNIDDELNGGLRCVEIFVSEKVVRQIQD